MTLVENFEKPHKKGGDRAGHEARKMAENERLAAERVAQEELMKPFTLLSGTFERKTASVVEGAGGFDIKVEIGDAGERVRVMKDLTFEQAQEIKAAGCLKPKGLGAGPA